MIPTNASLRGKHDGSYFPRSLLGKELYAKDHFCKGLVFHDPMSILRTVLFFGYVPGVIFLEILPSYWVKYSILEKRPGGLNFDLAKNDFGTLCSVCLRMTLVLFAVLVCGYHLTTLAFCVFRAAKEKNRATKQAKAKASAQSKVSEIDITYQYRFFFF